MTAEMTEAELAVVAKPAIVASPDELDVDVDNDESELAPKRHLHVGVVDV